MLISLKLRRVLWTAFFLFVLMNVIAYIHAYKFTHFSTGNETKTKDPASLTTIEKLGILFSGVNNPRPENTRFPSGDYQTVILKGNVKTECWMRKLAKAKGTVILFHGYGGNKSGMLGQADIFMQLGYHTLLVDFMGSGGSEGNKTSIGYLEALQVKSAFDYVLEQGEKHLFLFGTSMGAVAIMKAINDYGISPSGLILECPFGTMKETVNARFQIMGIPSFPMASMLVFWGGFQNGYNAFKHNPEEYAGKIHCPVLLLYGEKDEKVSPEEINRIFNNLSGPKRLKTYPMAGHDNYLNICGNEWVGDVQEFLYGI